MRRKSESEAWADEQIALLAEAHGLTVPSEKFAPVTVPDLKARRRRRQFDHGDQGRFVKWGECGDGTGVTELTPEELEAIRPRRRRKAK